MKDYEHEQIEELGARGNAVELERLFTESVDSGARVRNVLIVRELARVGRIESIPVLVRGLSAADYAVRTECARALGMYSGVLVREPLITALADENEDVRIAAIESFEELGDEASIHAVAERLIHGHRFERQAAAFALGGIATDEAVSALSDGYAKLRLCDRLVVVASLADAAKRKSSAYEALKGLKSGSRSIVDLIAIRCLLKRVDRARRGNRGVFVP